MNSSLLPLTALPIPEINSQKCLSRQLSNKQKQCRNFRKIHSLCKRCYQRYIDKGILDTIIPIPSLSFTNNKIPSYSKLVTTCIRIQQWYRSLHHYWINSFRGPARNNRTICSNDTDFYTCIPLTKIHYSYFFSYSDENLRIFGFDLRSIYKLLQYSSLNPYNTQEIPSNIIARVQYLWKQTYKQLALFSVTPLSKEKLYEQAVLTVCSKYDQLGYYLDVNAILELTSKQIILFYKYAEDIWNYRAQHLTIENKQKIVQDGIAFHIPIWMIRKYSPRRLKQLLLYEMTRFVEGPNNVSQNKENQIMGVLFILTALVQVSKKIYQAYPHLWQE